MTGPTTLRARCAAACAVLVGAVLVAAPAAVGPLRAEAAPAAPVPGITARPEVDGAGVGGPGAAGDGDAPAGPPRVQERPGDGPPGAGSRTGGRDGDDPEDGAAAVPGVATEHTRVPDCPANAPGGALDSLCNNATLTCPNPGEVRYRLYARPTAAPADGPAPLWVQQGQQCLTAADLAAAAAGPAAAPVAVVVTLADFQRVPFAPGTSLLAPPGGQALVNLAVHAHAAARVQVLPTVVQGAAVRVRATPVAYAWDFGDGATIGPSPDPGAAWPAGGHEHAYAAPGSRAVTMRTTYAGEFSVAGGPWQPIDGQVTIASPAQPVLVRTARASLVGDLLG